MSLTTSSIAGNFKSLFKKENFLSLKLVIIGFAAERNIIELRRKDVLSQDVIKRFMIDCCLIVIGILEKIFERSLN